MKMHENSEYEEDVETLCEYVNLRKVIPFDVKYWRCSAGSGHGDNYMSVVKRIEVSTHAFNDEFKENPLLEGDEEEGDLDWTLETGVQTHLLIPCPIKIGLARVPSWKNSQYFSFIVKRQILSQSRRLLFRCDEAFCNEINAYNYVIPILDKYFINGDTVFPQCYYAGTDKKGELIALDDLKRHGYCMPNRLVPFDLYHCEIVMKELAKLHATSIAAKHLNNNDFRERYRKVNEIVYCAEAENFYGDLLSASIEESLKSLRESNIDGSLSYSICVIEQLKAELYTKIMHSINNSNDCVSVMCHGDLYVNNIMFKSNIEEGTHQASKEVKFFDLQAMRYTSYIFDILHFMFTSTTRELRDAHTNRLLETYRQALNKRVEQLLDSREHLASIRRTFSLENIIKEFAAHALYGLAVSMWVLPAVTFDPNNIPNLDVISEAAPKANEIKVTQTLTAEYHSRIKDLALEFHENGYFGTWLEK